MSHEENLAQNLHQTLSPYFLMSFQQVQLMFFTFFCSLFLSSNESHLCSAVLWSVQGKGAQRLLPQPVCCGVHRTSGEWLPGNAATPPHNGFNPWRGEQGFQLHVLYPSSAPEGLLRDADLEGPPGLPCIGGCWEGKWHELHNTLSGLCWLCPCTFLVCSKPVLMPLSAQWVQHCCSASKCLL